MERLSLKTKIFYGMGDVYGGGAFNVIGFFYAIFLTDVVGIPPSYAAWIFLVGRIWDAVTDPLMGYISDRTRSPFGRRRIYFLVGIPLVFLSFYLLWCVGSSGPVQQRFLYALITYLFFNTVVTMVMVPYTALSAELTLDYSERTSLNSIRLAFSIGSSIICATLPMVVVNSFEDIEKGYRVMGALFGLIFALPWIGVFLFTYERKEFKPAESLNLKDLFLGPLKIRSFRLLLGMYLFAFMAIDAVSIIFAYYMKYYMKRPELLPIVLGVLITSELLFIPVVSFVARRTSKKTAYIVGAVSWMIVGGCLFAVDPDWPLWVIYIFASAIGCSVSFVAIMPYAMLGDVADVGELYYRERREGSISGFMTFARKLSSAFMQFVILSILGAAGYVSAPNVSSQPQAVLNTIKCILSFAPTVLLIFGVLCASRYPLSPEVHEKLKRVLEKLRKGLAVESEISQLLELGL